MQVEDAVDIIPGTAMPLDVVTNDAALTIINGHHGPGSARHVWATKAMFWVDVVMLAAANSEDGTRLVLMGGGELNAWLESHGHPMTKTFLTL